MKKWLMPAIAALAIVAGFCIPLGIRLGNNDNNKAVAKKINSFSRIDDKKYWTLSNSYNVVPSLNDGRLSIVENVRRVLDLDDSYQIKICGFDQDTDIDFDYIKSSITLDPLEPKILFQFQVVIAYKNNTIFRKKIDNSWILEEALSNKKLDYLDLFVGTNDDVSNDFINKLDDFKESNKEMIESNVVKYKLGTRIDASMIFSSIDYNDFKVNKENKTFYISESACADTLNKIVQFNSKIRMDETSFTSGRGHAYKYFSKIVIDDNYFHSNFALNHYDSMWRLDDTKNSIHPDTTIDELRKIVNNYFTKLMVDKTNLNYQDVMQGLTDGVFNVGLYKSGSTSNNEEYEENRTVSKMFGFTGDGPNAWIGLKSLKDDYEWLNKLIVFSSNYDERIYTTFSYTQGDTK